MEIHTLSEAQDVEEVTLGDNYCRSVCLHSNYTFDLNFLNLASIHFDELLCPDPQTWVSIYTELASLQLDY